MKKSKKVAVVVPVAVPVSLDEWALGEVVGGYSAAGTKRIALTGDPDEGGQVFGGALRRLRG